MGRVLAALGLLALVAVPARAAQFACGDVIGPGTTVSVDNDLVGCPEVGLRIVGPVTVDLNGSFVLCEPDSSNVGLVIEGRGVKLRGGRVAGCTAGVQVRGRDHRVTGVTVEESFVGVFVDAADRSRVESCTLEDVEFGIQTLPGTERNQIVGNRLAGVAQTGIQVGGGRHRIAGNEVELAGGVAYEVAGSRHVLTRNVGRGEVGYLVTGSGHRLDRNRAQLGGDGVGRTDGTGFFVTGERIALLRNVARRNLGPGFHLTSAVSLRVERNEAELNGEHGFVLADVADAVLRKNVASSNFGGDGILVEAGAENVVVRDNTSTGHALPHRDLRDASPTCAGTRWLGNAFGTAFPSCVR